MLDHLLDQLLLVHALVHLACAVWTLVTYPSPETAQTCKRAISFPAIPQSPLSPTPIGQRAPDEGCPYGRVFMRHIITFEDMNFGECTFRDRPKRVGRACGVALRTTETVLPGPFWSPYTAKIHASSVACTPFRTVSLGTSVTWGNRSGRDPESLRHPSYISPDSRRTLV